MFGRKERKQTSKKPAHEAGDQAGVEPSTEIITHSSQERWPQLASVFWALPWWRAAVFGWGRSHSAQWSQSLGWAGPFLRAWTTPPSCASPGATVDSLTIFQCPISVFLYSLPGAGLQLRIEFCHNNFLLKWQFQKERLICSQVLNNFTIVKKIFVQPTCWWGRFICLYKAMVWNGKLRVKQVYLFTSKPDLTGWLKS